MALKSADEALLIAQRLVRRSWEEAAAQFTLSKQPTGLVPFVIAIAFRV